MPESLQPSVLDSEGTWQAPALPHNTNIAIKAQESKEDGMIHE